MMPISLVKTRVSIALLLLILLFTPTPSYSISFPLSNYRSLLFLSHSLTSRVADLRASRGDSAGSSRARAFTRKIESVQGLGLWKLIWTFGWDYCRNYAWRDFNTVSLGNIASAVPDLNELLRSLNDLSRVDSDSERVAWVGRNYGRILTVSQSLFGKLLSVFRQSGPLRDVVETMLKEVVEGELLRDCLELGSNDLLGVIKILKDMASQYTSSAPKSAEL